MTVTAAAVAAGATQVNAILATGPMTHGASGTSSGSSGVEVILIVAILVLVVGLIAALLRLRRAATDSASDPTIAQPDVVGSSSGHTLDPSSSSTFPPSGGASGVGSTGAGDATPAGSGPAAERPDDELAAQQRDSLAATCMRAADLLPGQPVAAMLHRGVEESGYSILEPTGERFDPEVHEAVDQEATNDANLNGVVASTERAGYAYAGRVLRMPQVVVYSIDHDRARQ
jgi:hypothetical protein